jgi:hypothetical protein
MFIPVLLLISIHALDHLEKIQKSAALWYLEHLVSQVSYTPQRHCKHILQGATLTGKHHKFQYDSRQQY